MRRSSLCESSAAGRRYCPNVTDSTRRRVTTNLRLRAVTLDDLPTVMAIERDPKTNKHRPGDPPTPEDVKERLRAVVQTWDEHGVGYWIAEHQGKAVGLAGLRRLGFRGRPCWNLYYRFSPRVWGAASPQKQPARPLLLPAPLNRCCRSSPGPGRPTSRLSG